MKIVVCFKNVPDERDIRVNSDRSIDLSNAALSIGSYDLNAVEAGAQLLDANADAELIALTVGDSRSAGSKLKKDVLSRGPQSLVVVEDESLADADAMHIAEAIAAAVRRMGDVDLVLFGEGSGDMYNQQVGILVGFLLGIPTINAVSRIDAQGSCFEVTRSLEDSEETMTVESPCALSVTSDSNVPRISGMKAILSAGKKPMEVVPLADLDVKEGKTSKTVGLVAPEKAPRRCRVFEDVDDASFEEFYQILRKAL